METLLHKYFLDECDLEKAGWAAPFRTKPLPPTLRGDVLDFVSTHFAESNTAAKQGQAQAPLTGRAIARILLHIIPDRAALVRCYGQPDFETLAPILRKWLKDSQPVRDAIDKFYVARPAITPPVRWHRVASASEF